MKILDASPFIKSQHVPWFHLFLLPVARQEFRHWINAEPVVDWVDGLGDADYWVAEFECGMKIAFEFIHGYPPAVTPAGIILATEFNSQHVQRHLPEWKPLLKEIPHESMAPDREYLFKTFAHLDLNPATQSRWQLMRMGDDGNPMPIGLPTSKLDADCQRAQFEARGHKQMYWIDETKSRSS